MPSTTSCWLFCGLVAPWMNTKWPACAAVLSIHWARASPRTRSRTCLHRLLSFKYGAAVARQWRVRPLTAWWWASQVFLRYQSTSKSSGRPNAVATATMDRLVRAPWLHHATLTAGEVVYAALAAEGDRAVVRHALHVLSDGHIGTLAPSPPPAWRSCAHTSCSGGGGGGGGVMDRYQHRSRVRPSVQRRNVRPCWHACDQRCAAACCPLRS
jgi:hypothetical protein